MGSKVQDKDTGDIIEEPLFVKLYVEHVCLIKRLNDTQYRMVWFMLGKMDSQNEVIFRTRHKKEFCRDSGMSVGTFNNNVHVLIEAGLIRRLGQNEFLFNKKYAVKTDWWNAQSIKWECEFTKEGVTERVLVDDKELPY